MRLSGFLLVAMMSFPEGASLEESVAKVRSELINEAPYKNPLFSGPLCGVYASSTALNLVGVSANEADFLTAAYVGSCEGSSAENICAMVESAGGRAYQSGRLSAFDIRAFSGPIVANVRRNPSDDRFSHWVVVRAHGSGVLVYDGPGQPRQTSMGEFLSVWSGIGVLVSNSAIDPSLPLWLGRSAMLLTCVLGLAALVHFRSNIRSRLERASILKQIAVLFSISVIACLIGNAFLGDLIHHQDSVELASAHTASEYKTGTLDDVIDASNDTSTLLVDARRRQDFLLGSVSLAVNIPVDSAEWETRERLASLDRNAKIVVFCQSKACQFDETVAKQLVGMGFRDVTVSQGGWREYVQSFATVDSSDSDSR